MNINQPTENIALPGLKKKRVDLNNPEQLGQHRRLRGLGWLPVRFRSAIVAVIGEFVGTFMFLFMAFSATQVANITSPSAPQAPGLPNVSALLYISLAFGFSLAVNAWVFFRISGGLFNPAVTLGMCLIGAVPYLRGLLIVGSQLVGGIAAAAVVSALFPGTLGVRTSLSPGVSIVRGLFIEMFLTAQLVFTIFMLAAEKHKATFIAPVGIGLALFISELAGVFFTGGSLNPARSFGPAVVAVDFHGYHWIYWVGPALGSLVAVGFYQLVKALEYETVNPGQDAANEKEAEALEKQNSDATPTPTAPMYGSTGVDATPNFPGTPGEFNPSAARHTTTQTSTVVSSATTMNNTGTTQRLPNANQPNAQAEGASPYNANQTFASQPSQTNQQRRFDSAV